MIWLGTEKTRSTPSHLHADRTQTRPFARSVVVREHHEGITQHVNWQWIESHPTTVCVVMAILPSLHGLANCRVELCHKLWINNDISIITNRCMEKWWRYPQFRPTLSDIKSCPLASSLRGVHKGVTGEDGEEDTQETITWQHHHQIMNCRKRQLAVWQWFILGIGRDITRRVQVSNVDIVSMLLEYYYSKPVDRLENNTANGFHSGENEWWWLICGRVFQKSSACGWNRVSSYK